jgi:thioredoxin 1
MAKVTPGYGLGPFSRGNRLQAGCIGGSKINKAKLRMFLAFDHRSIVFVSASPRALVAVRPAGKAFSACILVALGMALAMLGGCATEGKIQPIATTADFQQQVVEAKGPVLVDFYKDNCPTCVLQEACLDALADEYAGEVRFAKFKVREAYMLSSCPEFMDYYKLFWVPTVILFVDGQEKHRWVLNHGANDFRPALDEVSGKALAAGPAPVGPAGAATSGGALPAAVWPSLLAVPGAQDQTECVEGQGCPVGARP